MCADELPRWRGVSGSTSMKLSFKKHARETGLRAVGNPYPDTDIKLGGKKVGYLDAPSWNSADRQWRIRFAIKRQQAPGFPANFDWVTLTARFDTEPEAREFVKQNIEKIKAKFDLYLLED